MNKEIEKRVAKTVIGIATKTAKLPNQMCIFFMGKPNTQMNLTVRDYENLEKFINKNS